MYVCLCTLRAAGVSILSTPGVELDEEDEDGGIPDVPYLCPRIRLESWPKSMKQIKYQLLSRTAYQSVTHNTDHKRNNELYPVTLNTSHH